MNNLRESGVIDEINCGSNFGYILKENMYFVNTDYKVLQSQAGDIFLSCMKMTHNGCIEFYYITNEYVPVSNLLTGIQADVLMNIMLNFIRDIIEVRNNGFLSFQNIDVSWDRIYVDMKNLKVKLVYVPVNYKLYNNYPEFENDLRGEIVKLVSHVAGTGASSERFERFVWGLTSGSMSLSDVYNQCMTGGIGSEPVKSGPIESYAYEAGEHSGFTPADSLQFDPIPVPVASPERFLKLVLVNSMQPVSITLERENTVIGKKQELVDACITFNNMISRKHCSIVRQGDKYFIMDEESSNGTYVNGMRLVPKQYQQIVKGDMIRMADSDFQLV